MSIERQLSDARMSAIVVHSGTVYLSGEVANDLSGDICQQTRETLANIEGLLDRAGTDKTRVLSATIYLKDIQADFAVMNEVWSAWLSPGQAPARTTLQAALARPQILVEISVIAARR